MQFQKGKKHLMGRIKAASELLMITQNEKRHQFLTGGLASGHREVTTILLQY